MGRRYHEHRIKLSKDKVHHLKEPLGRCFVCGKPAMHRVAEEPGPIPAVFSLDLCTHHFTRMFKMPANRFPKKAKIKQTKEQLATLKAIQSRTFVLRRHMETPLVILGERLVSHHYDLGGKAWYFALYRTVSGRMYVSGARVFGKTMAFNIVEEAKLNDFIEATKRMLHAQGVIFPIGETEMLRITMECTKFFEMAAKYAEVI